MTEKPQRIQLSRKKGWRMPPNTKKIDRRTTFGNPFVVGGEIRSVEHAVHLFSIGINRPDRELLADPRFRFFTRENIQRNLRGKNLACWCKPTSKCHADILLEIANGPLCPQLSNTSGG